MPKAKATENSSADKFYVSAAAPVQYLVDQITTWGTGKENEIRALKQVADDKGSRVGQLESDLCPDLSKLKQDRADDQRRNYLSTRLTHTYEFQDSTSNYDKRGESEGLERWYDYQQKLQDLWDEIKGRACDFE